MEHLASIYDAPKLRFEKHLLPKDNRRIIFSGIYGTGKTYFLENFFNIKTSERKDLNDTSKYHVIRLFPVNYSVENNEDIFKLIKYDILLELLQVKNLNFETLDFGLEEYLKLYLDENIYSFTGRIINSIAKICKPLSFEAAAIETVLNFFTKENTFFKKYIKQKSKGNDDIKDADEFIKLVQKENSNVYADNIIIKIIEKYIEKIRDSKKEVILLIDDLDRIDPEHIFRILNIFTAQMDTKHSKENRFGFDKVILVCDIDNIRSIFHHRYGKEANFFGYIDKFYSTEVFHLQNEYLITSAISRILEKYQYEISHENMKILNRGQNLNNQIITYLLRGFLRTRKLNLRKVLRFIEYDLKISIDGITLGDNFFHPATNMLLLQLILISKIFGEKHAFLYAIRSLNFSNLDTTDVDTFHIFQEFMLLDTINEHKFYRTVNDIRYAFEPTKPFKVSILRSSERGLTVNLTPAPSANVNTTDWQKHYEENLINLMEKTILTLYDLEILR